MNREPRQGCFGGSDYIYKGTDGTGSPGWPDDRAWAAGDTVARPRAALVEARVPDPELGRTASLPTRDRDRDVRVGVLRTRLAGRQLPHDLRLDRSQRRLHGRRDPA